MSQNESCTPAPGRHGDEELQLAGARLLAAAAGTLVPPPVLLESGACRLPFPGFFCEVETRERLTPDEIDRVARAAGCSRPHAAGASRPGEAELDGGIHLHIWSEPSIVPGGTRAEGTRQRILGIARASRIELRRAVAALERAAESDHRFVGRDLRLFELAGPEGSDAVWLPRGMILRRLLLERWMPLLRAAGFAEVETPALPSHGGEIALFRSEPRGAAELPLRCIETRAGERPGSAGGAGLRRSHTRTRWLLHVFCDRPRIEAELAALIGVIEAALRDLGIRFKSERGAAPSARRCRLASANIFGEIEHPAGEVEVVLDESAGLTCIAERAARSPVWLLRAAIGHDIEHLVAAVVERFAGRLPLWLSPIQVRVAPRSVGDASRARELHDELIASGLRSQVDARKTRVLTKLRDAINEGIPHVILVGGRATESETVTLFSRESRREEEIPASDTAARLAASAAAPAPAPLARDAKSR